MDACFEGSAQAGSEIAIAPRAGSELVTPASTLRDQLAAAWIMEVGNGSENTAAAYRGDITTFFGWADEAGLDVLALLPVHVAGYRRWLQTAEHAGRYRGSRKLSPATVARKLSAVSSWFRFGMLNAPGLVATNPADAERSKRPTVPQVSLTMGLSREEADQLRRVALARGTREYALVQLLLGTGLRVSEVCNADTGDLKREGTSWYLEVVRKGGARSLVGVPDPAARALRRYMRGRRGPLFQGNAGERMTRRQAAYWITAMTKAAGITKTISPHSMRHTVATMLLDSGVSISDVQSLLGHTTIATTARYDRARRERNNPGTAVLATIIEDDLPDVAV